MKSARQQKRKAVGAPREQNLAKVCNATKKTSRNSQKATGVIGHSSPPSALEAFPHQLLVKGTYSPQTKTKLPVLELHPGQTLRNPSAKIKLQLFPIDDTTRLELEKDGHNPYLELTLRAQKKISSVLKHLNSKWGCSSIAHGELVLFPYKALENSANSRGWTSNDSEISAGDVYAAIGSPAVFRLRYGWFSNSDTTTSGVPSASTVLKHSLQQVCNSKQDSTHGSEKPVEVISEECKPVAAEETKAAVAEKIFADETVYTVDNGVKTDQNLAQPSSFWGDSLTNISIGGLFSEASLHGRINSFDPKSNGSNASFQPSQLISDSFDAFIAAQLNQSQAPRLPQDLRSSILDAEDTCHAFPSQKPSSSSSKGFSALRGNGHFGGCSQDIGSNPFKFPKSIEVSTQSGLPQDRACQESETDLLLCSRGYNDESSLGLTGIKWNDSLGPFDLGISSGKISKGGGDSVSLSGFVR